MKTFVEKLERFYNEKEVNISSVLRDYFGMSSGSQKMLHSKVVKSGAKKELNSRGHNLWQGYRVCHGFRLTNREDYF